MSHEAPNLMLLLSNGKKSLIDKFSVCAQLTQDLYNAQYQVNLGGRNRGLKRRRKLQPRQIEDTDIPSSSSSSKRSSLTLKELENESDVDDNDALEGFLDEHSGEKVYLIDKVIKYDPKYGYFVHWQGYPKSERSWQLPEDMPSAFAKEMALARSRYRESRKTAYIK